MKIDFPYGHGVQTLEIPDSEVQAVLRPAFDPDAPQPEKTSSANKEISAAAANFTNISLWTSFFCSCGSRTR